MTQFTYDVCIIGTGRVGLPLALSLIDVGMSVTGVDRDPALRAAVNEGRMPFHEPGYEGLVASGRLRIHGTPEVVAESRTIVITVGTPLHNHIETDLSQIQRVLDEICSHLVPGQLVCLRSTVAPGTTTFVRRWLEQRTPLRVGEDLKLAFCPERIAEGRAREELRSLPQIIGTEDPASREAASELFSRLAPECLGTDYITAELVKLFNNIARYVHFAMANQFALIADTFHANIYEIRQLANYQYPRSYIAAPGLTAGTCLRKDFGMINEWSPYPDLLMSAWKMNEYIPAFLVQHLLQRTSLLDRRVALLGYSFKKDTDDVRDSLAPKLYRYIQRQLPSEIRVTDRFLSDPLPEAGNGTDLRNWTTDAALADADCVFVATNHTGYEEALRATAVRRPEAWIADIWNVGGIDRIFYQAGDLA
jgi:UDP-N-acetyl-D-mannosaminuronic acid dehydrogenase